MLVWGDVVDTPLPLTLRIEATFIRHLRQVDTMGEPRILAGAGGYKLCRKITEPRSPAGYRRTTSWILSAISWNSSPRKLAGTMMMPACSVLDAIAWRGRA